MELEFYKYHGAGNDFVLLDNRKKKYSALTRKQIAFICNRHFGIGADGLITLNKEGKSGLQMVYYNADGGIGSMCGNGSRCFILFAKELGLVKKTVSFMAYDGIHHASILTHKSGKAEIKVSMGDVTEIKKIKTDLFLNTGSPHYVKFVSDTGNVDVFNEGKKIRYNSTFKKVGTNVNFVSVKNNTLFIRTYERGVENETLACGTGITASAIAANFANKIPASIQEVNVVARGGNLKVSFQKLTNAYSNIYLSGPAQFVFSGVIKI